MNAAARPISRHTYAIEQRLRLIDFLLHQYGTLNRSALVDYFGISTPQAAADIKLYLQIAPNDCIGYDKRRKCYVRLGGFQRVFP